jgi:peptidoglycan/LPS O-acetylase OafA/YrhL
VTNFQGRIVKIQHLRALAVLAVLFYHLKLGFPRGYLGVDVFFVVSGFVITRSILIKNNEFRLKQTLDFYFSRILRLLPAFAMMNLVVLIGVLLFLSPNIGVQQQAIKSGFGSILGISNFLIPRLTGGYFDTPSQSNPYLHTWSLSVEEQFYVVFPILMFLCFLKNVHRFLTLLRIVIPITFFTGSILLTIYPELIPSLSKFAPFYFSPLPRIWQFMLGMFTAIYVLSKKNSIQKLNFFFWPLFVALILFVNVEHSSLIIGMFGSAILTTALLLSSSADSKIDTLKAYEKFLTYLGDRSYSIYLWHWPIIVFLPTAVIGLSKVESILISLLITFIASELSFRYLETKTMNRLKGQNGRIFTRTLASLCFLLTFLLSSAWFVQSGMGQNWALTNHTAIKKNCDQGRDQLPTTLEDDCKWISKIDSNLERTIFIFGDSLAWSGSDSIIEAGNSLGYTVKLFTRNGCFARLSDDKDASPCGEWSRNVFGKVRSDKPEIVFLLGNFTEKELPQETLSLLENLQELEQKTVLMLPPPWGDSFSEIKSFINIGLNKNRQGGRPIDISVPAEYQLGSFRLFNPSDVICKGQACPISTNGEEFYNYGNHLSVYGNQLLIKPITNLLKEFGRT